MKSKDFCYWLTVFLTSKETLLPEQLEEVRTQLNSVFLHEIDPSMPDPNGELQEIHDTKNDKSLFIVGDKFNVGKVNMIPNPNQLYKC